MSKAAEPRPIPHSIEGHPCRIARLRYRKELREREKAQEPKKP